MFRCGHPWDGRKAGLGVVALTTALALAALAGDGALTNAPVAPSTNPPPIGLSLAVPVPATNAVPEFVVRLEPTPDPSEPAYRDLLALDDAAQEEMDRWIREADAAGENADNAGLQRKIDARVSVVDEAYRKFIERYPEHVRARVAFGSFLNDTGRELPAREQWELALKLDPLNPAIHNNLAGIYGHRGPITNAFVHYEKAIALDPKEALYYQNFATAVFLFRKDVMEHYRIADEQQVFDKALGLYRKATELQPDNFILAADLAQTFYGIKPPRHEEALKAWRRVLTLAGDDLEREGVRVHLARTLVQAGRLEEARAELGRITNAVLATMKGRIQKTLEQREHGGTNAVPERADP